ncbi:C-type mannose receptor 2-like [Thalassophryne amazonica]|uniref:C-type mannose receptor 2-like n=1 Tax=Thalassophryne amazonica TaxID=390379 RepID=UPI001471B883|nr:C-type mannose receptor 2-like [Thalassophryne amazonica]
MLWFVLLVLGQCLSVTCQLYHYYFINQEKTWEDAQNHCREKHTDLATVMSMEDVTSLLNAASENTGNTREAWIGLKNDGNFTWRWSLPGVDGKETNWDVNQPDNPRKENCGTMWKSGKWNNLVCSEMRNFICYDETNKKFHLIKEEKNWFEAQHYCREKHTDLVSGMNQLNQEELKKEANPNNVGSQEIFIGLFSDTWKWSDGRNMSFRHWHPDFFTDQLNVTRCATTSFNQTARNSKWGYNECNQTKTFFCYNVELVLIKANKTWTDALDYCRKHHKGLVSITTPGDQMLVQDMLQEATTEYVWLGLHYSCVVDLWLWVTDEPFCDDSWERYQLRRNECGVSAAMSTQSPYNWTTKCDQTPFNFICVK